MDEEQSRYLLSPVKTLKRTGPTLYSLGRNPLASKHHWKPCSEKEEITCPTEDFVKSPFARLLPKHCKGFAFAHLPPAVEAQNSSVRRRLCSEAAPQPANPHSSTKKGCGSYPTVLLRKDDGGVTIIHNFFLVMHTLRRHYLTVRSHVFQMAP